MFFCRYVSSSTLSPSERLQVYAHQVETLKAGLASAVQRTKKLEKKYKVLSAGYTNRQKELAKAISEAQVFLQEKGCIRSIQRVIFSNTRQAI